MNIQCMSRLMVNTFQTRPHKPDLILLDVMMPGNDGYETLRKLQTMPEGRNIPRHLPLTAKADSEGEKEGLPRADYITKPYTPSLVKLRIRNQLENKRYRDHLEDLRTNGRTPLRQTRR